MNKFSICPICKTNINVTLRCDVEFTKKSLFYVGCRECGTGANAENGEYDNPVDAILSWGLKDIDQLQARIKELESERHINEIKAQGIDESLTEASKSGNANPYVTEFIMKLESYTEKLRTNHD